MKRRILFHIHPLQTFNYKLRDSQQIDGLLLDRHEKCVAGKLELQQLPPKPLIQPGKHQILHRLETYILLMLQKSGEPVDMVNIPLFTGFYTSQVVQDSWTINRISVCFLVSWTHHIDGGQEWCHEDLCPHDLRVAKVAHWKESCIIYQVILVGAVFF